MSEQLEAIPTSEVFNMLHISCLIYLCLAVLGRSVLKKNVQAVT